MNNRTVAYPTHRLSRVTTMAGWRHHGSWRKVFSAICARDLAGTSETCVILDVLACLRSDCALEYVRPPQVIAVARAPLVHFVSGVCVDLLPPPQVIPVARARPLKPSPVARGFCDLSKIY